MPSFGYDTLEELARTGYLPHPVFKGVVTLPAFARPDPTVFEVKTGRIRLTLHRMDYIRLAQPGKENHMIRFQQDRYRLWYQIGGTGILQNTTRKSFGTARPGLLGIMEPGERHTYLHQRDTFEAFLIDFSLDSSTRTKCYWNTEIEGKKVLEEKQRITFENTVFAALQLFSLPQRSPAHDLAVCARLSDVVAELFEQRLLLFQDEQFPRDKPRRLVEMARRFMLAHYASLHHQNDLEKECGVDINYLNILFKRQTGHTLYAFLSNIRLEHSRHLLEDSQINVTDIASRVGYPNSNSFTRLFRKKTGLTPSEYRKKYTETNCSK